MRRGCRDGEGRGVRGHIQCGRDGGKACALPPAVIVSRCHRPGRSEVGRGGAGQGRAAVVGPEFITSSLPTRCLCLLRSGRLS